jgi:hypothetical protein
MIFAVERNGLQLSDYLAQVAVHLQAKGVVVQSTQIDTSWRADRLPVGLLHYTLPTGEATGVEGLQIVALDGAGTRLVVFTFVTPAADSQALAPLYRQIVQGARFF